MSAAFNIDAVGPWVEQLAGSELDYTLDWSESLEADDEIASVEWTADAGLTVDRKSHGGLLATAWLSGGLAGRSYAVRCAVTTASGRMDSKVFRLFVRDPGAAAMAAGRHSAFAPLPEAVARFRRDRLAGPMRTWMAGTELSDEYVAERLLAAEAHAERRLRVFLTPTEVLPPSATQDEKDALDAAGTRWRDDPGHDHDPRAWNSPRQWGAIWLRHRPVLAVHGVRIVLPGGRNSGHMDVPQDWLRVDPRAGEVQMVPSGGALGLAFGGVGLALFGAGLNLPLAVHVRYRAGLADVRRDVPDLLALVQRMAVLDILGDGFIAASGSISADGLSQSRSWDPDKQRAEIDGALDKIRQSLLGVRMMVL